MEELNIIDYIILGIMLISVLVAYTRGVITEVLSLLVWIGAIIGATLYFEDVAKMLPNILYDSPASNLADATDPNNRNDVILTSILSFLITFFGLLFILGLVNLVISLFIRHFKINFIDRLLGAAFGVLRGILIVAFISMFIITSPLSDHPYWQEARLSPTVTEWANSLSTIIPEDFLSKINSRSLLEDIEKVRTSTEHTRGLLDQDGTSAPADSTLNQRLMEQNDQ